MIDQKSKILNAFIEIATEDGFSNHIIDKVAIKADIAKEEILLIFNQGVFDILAFYFEGIKDKVETNFTSLKQTLSHQELNSKTHLIKLVLSLYFEVLTKDSSFVKNLSCFLLRPKSLIFATKLDAEIVDFIWHLTDDNSKGFDFYTKRISLGIIFNLCKARFAAKGFNCKIDDFVSTSIDTHVKGVKLCKGLCKKIMSFR